MQILTLPTFSRGYLHWAFCATIISPRMKTIPDKVFGFDLEHSWGEKKRAGYSLYSR